MLRVHLQEWDNLVFWFSDKITILQIIQNYLYCCKFLYLLWHFKIMDTVGAVQCPSSIHQPITKKIKETGIVGKSAHLVEFWMSDDFWIHDPTQLKPLLKYFWNVPKIVRPYVVWWWSDSCLESSHVRQPLVSDGEIICAMAWLWSADMVDGCGDYITLNYYSSTNSNKCLFVQCSGCLLFSVDNRIPANALKILY